MLEPMARLLVATVGVYLAVGVVFAVPFVWRGVARIDPCAAAGSIGFRLLILPGVTALWPLLAFRWWRGTPPPEEHNPHRRAALGGG